MSAVDSPTAPARMESSTSFSIFASSSGVGARSAVPRTISRALAAPM